MSSIDPSWGAWGLFVSAFISSTIAPGGSEVVLALLVSEAQHSNLSLILIATLGNSLGALTTWWLGVLVAKGYPVGRVGGINDKALGAVRRWGVPVLLLSWMPVVGDGLCFAAGWLRLPLAKSLLAIVIGKAVRYYAIVYAFQ